MAQNRLDKRRARNRNIKLYVLMNGIDEGRFYRQNKLKNIPVQFFFKFMMFSGPYLHLRFRLFSLDLIFGNTSF